MLQKDHRHAGELTGLCRADCSAAGDLQAQISEFRNCTPNDSDLCTLSGKTYETCYCYMRIMESRARTCVRPLYWCITHILVCEANSTATIVVGGEPI
jgi:hypothetical protein